MYHRNHTHTHTLIHHIIHNNKHKFRILLIICVSSSHYNIYSSIIPTERIRFDYLIHEAHTAHTTEKHTHEEFSPVTIYIYGGTGVNLWQFNNNL